MDDFGEPSEYSLRSQVNGNRRYYAELAGSRKLVIWRYINLENTISLWLSPSIHVGLSEARAVLFPLSKPNGCCSKAVIQKRW